MERLTKKEEELMRFFWKNDAWFVKELLDFYDEPKPHFNTLSTIVRGLEEKGYLSHKTYGNTHQYFSIIGEDEYSRCTLRKVISKYFDDSCLRAVSALIQNEHLSIEELKQLINEVESKKTY
jgi:predicted transcriptional regulator